MGIALIKIKIMPKSPDTNLEDIKNKAYDIVAENDGKNIIIDEEPVAFGLKAIIISFDLNEDMPLEPIETSLVKIKNVNSAKVIDMRRAFG